MKRFLSTTFSLFLFTVLFFSFTKSSFAACDTTTCPSTHVGYQCQGVNTCEEITRACRPSTGPSGTCTTGSHGPAAQNQCCPGGGTCLNGACSTGATCAGQGGSCKTADQCTTEGGSNVGTVNCAPNICCTPPGGGGGGGGGGGSTPPASGAYPTKPICLGRYAYCTQGKGPHDTVDPNGGYCCPGLSCVGGDHVDESSHTYEYMCDRPPSPRTDSSCNADGSSCGTALGTIPTSGPGVTNALFKALLSISGALAVLLIIISGYRIMISQGNPEKLQAARDQLTSAILGLLFIIFSLVILETIGVDLLGLSSFMR